ncbi:AlpA family phage regulatory protein [Colwellia sp. 6M3]|jgi:predicted DNA-binding transcriptional regulator AlpA|uniref:AlpA family phage regulatory protein n=1 Tax=Colwellia sp. 6M3 TaxID=2759849 RepID=UPI0015F6CCDB|nr:AlpA family phage regulatory protein [Colwellia sp. 6M3]MBA6415822.1 AlpA family phage regulatory protein [Colwellia sp. 6M3]
MNKPNPAILLRETIGLAPIYDRIVKEAEREKITAISRSQCFQLERKNQFPKRVRLSSHSVGWRLSELLKFVESLHTV